MAMLSIEKFASKILAGRIEYMYDVYTDSEEHEKNIRLIHQLNSEVDHHKILCTMREDIRRGDYSNIIKNWNGIFYRIPFSYSMMRLFDLNWEGNDSSKSGGGLISIAPPDLFLDQVVCEMLAVRDLLKKLNPEIIHTFKYPIWMNRGFDKDLPLILSGDTNLKRFLTFKTYELLKKRCLLNIDVSVKGKFILLRVPSELVAEVKYKFSRTERNNCIMFVDNKWLKMDMEGEYAGYRLLITSR